ncbi:hypothetical protein JCM16161A_04550 [Vulcanisaeta sp. JCM 16161]
MQSTTPHTAYILSLIGSILMLISSIIVLVGAGILMTFPHLFAFRRFGYYPMMAVMPLAPILLLIVGVIGLIVSVLALYFSVRLGRLSDVNAVHSTGIVLLILAIIGLFVANGFFIGFILLLIGSILAITWKP